MSVAVHKLDRVETVGRSGACWKCTCSKIGPTFYASGGTSARERATDAHLWHYAAMHKGVL